MDEKSDRLARAVAALERLIAAKKAGSSLAATLEPLRDRLRAALEAGVSATAIASELKKALDLSQTEPTIRKAIRKVVEETQSPRRRSTRARGPKPGGRLTSTHQGPGPRPAQRPTVHLAQSAVPPAARVPSAPPAGPAAGQQGGLPLGQADELPDWMSSSPIRRVTDDR